VTRADNGTSGDRDRPGTGLAAPAEAPAVVFEKVSFTFDDHVVLRDVSFTLPKGRMKVLLGASGSGKSVLLKLMLGLFKPDAGTITINGERIDTLPETELMRVRSDIGMLFQETALFDSLTVAENVGYRLYEESDAPLEEVRRRVEEVLGFVGLSEVIDRMPSALSGGQRRRVALARAMASKPGLLLLDDPTVGLDPVTATTISDQIVTLRDTEQVTAIVATHQMRDAFYLATHDARRAAGGEVEIVEVPESAADRVVFMVLHDARIYFEGTGSELRQSKDEYLQEFLYLTLPPW
jgi:phospholipid/cholesterol/gamma-HCH transport system ATP-binding protein